MSKLNELIEMSSEKTNFRYIANIDKVSIKELKKYNYYIGFPCAHGHVIRDKDEHWCYHCAIKIQSNICGFDINYLNIDYKTKYHTLWKKIDIKAPEDCWPVSLPGENIPNRVCFPSYRSQYSCQKSENINAHKVIYSCVWGDVGSLSVTRLCSNPWCMNPLHMMSKWNRRSMPKKVTPFVLDFDAKKLMRISKAISINREEEIKTENYKKTITNPLDVKDTPDYDEG